MVGCCPVPSVTSWGCGIVQWSMYRQPAVLRPGPGSQQPAARSQQLAASTMWPWQSPFPGCLLASSSLSWTRPAACQAHHSTDVPLNNNNNNNNINYNLCLSVNLICRDSFNKMISWKILSVSQKRFALQNLGFCQTAHWHLSSHWQLKKMKQILDFFIERPTGFCEGSRHNHKCL